MNDEVRLLRAATVWGTATVAAAGLIVWLAPVAAGPRAPGFVGWLVAGSGLVGALCVTWLWVLTTAVVVDVVRGRTAPRAGVPGAVRRIVLAACGAALASGLLAPAHADQGPAAEPGPRPATTAALLVGLPLPDRTTTTTRWQITPGACVILTPELGCDFLAEIEQVAIDQEKPGKAKFRDQPQFFREALTILLRVLRVFAGKGFPAGARQMTIL